MRKFVYLVLTLALVAAPLGAAAMDINIDVVKKGGPTAWDFALVLAGSETITGTYNGYPSGVFGKTKFGYGKNTVVHWENPSGSVAGDGIDDGELIHVGVSVKDGDADVIDSYWTDKNGARILNSDVVIAGGHLHPVGIAVTNGFAFPADLVSVRAAVLDAPLPLSELNRENAALAFELQPLGGTFSLAPGEERFLALPVAPEPGQAVVWVVETESAESDALVMNFQQAIAQ